MPVMGDEGVNGGAEAAAPVPVSSPVSHCFPLSSKHNNIAGVITAALLLSACVSVSCVCEFMCELCEWCKEANWHFVLCLCTSLRSCLCSTISRAVATVASSLPFLLSTPHPHPRMLDSCVHVGSPT